MDNTASGILSRLNNEIPARYRKGVGSYAHDILAPVAIELENAYGQIDRTTERLLVDTATGSDLDKTLGQFGFTRKNATYAVGEVTVYGADDAVINAGELVAAGKTVYIVQQTAALTGGSATVSVVAEEPGSDGNVAAGAVNYFPVMPSKITSVTNKESITGGTDEESDAEYRERYYYFLDHPVTSGNKYEYEQWAREVDGVGIAKCYPLWNGAGTVKVVITTAELDPAPDSLVRSVADYIEERRPIGAQVTVEGAGVISVYVSAKVVCDPAYSIVSITDRYKNSLSEYFKSIGFSGGLLPYTKIGSLLQEISGVEYYSNLTVNDAADNISVSDGQLAVLGGVTLE